MAEKEVPIVGTKVDTDDYGETAKETGWGIGLIGLLFTMVVTAAMLVNAALSYVGVSEDKQEIPGV